MQNVLRGVVLLVVNTALGRSYSCNVDGRNTTTRISAFKKEAVKQIGTLLSPVDGNQLIVRYVEELGRFA